MLETADPVTYQLAAFIGAMALATGIGGWRHPGNWAQMFDEFDRSPGLVLITGMIALIFGALVILLPGGWSDPLATLVSAIGLASFVEGLALLAFPDRFLRLARPLLRFARPWSVFAMLLGALLFAAGVAGMLH